MSLLRERLRLVIRGMVQGVGFRPFVYRLATRMKLSGWVQNSAGGVWVEAEGPHADLESFLLGIEQEKPPRAFIHSLEPSFLMSVGYQNFEIRPSAEGEKTALVMPDIATCSDCINDIFDPKGSRYGYPFTNCTNCGPRFSIIEALPYDRKNTAMKYFSMCAKCQDEYDDPENRRFHAEPNACPACGPHLELWNSDGDRLNSFYQGFEEAVDAIEYGKIVAVKGLGGFHLVVNATHEDSVRRLRERKHREGKPFALMFPDVNSVREECELSPLEERLLVSPEAPIVLLRRKRLNSRTAVVPSVAPNNPYLGVMLPYTPLHHLILRELRVPIVATSGNLAEEPIVTDEKEALHRLKGIADLFLVHNRPIIRHVDDSIVRVMMGRELVLRRARGFAPLPVLTKEHSSAILAVGAQLKNTIAQSVGNRVFVSQHIGDLENEKAFSAFKRTIDSFRRLYDLKPATIGCDLHPNYNSTQFAEQSNLSLIRIQHHYAHILSCMAENELEAPVFGVAWDGTGLGTDGTIWGGEFLRINEDSFERIGHLRNFRLPGSELAVKEPRRSAIGLLYELLGEEMFERKDFLPFTTFTPAELGVLKKMLEKQINTPIASSAGRLFDAVSSIIGLCHQTRFEGQAATELEFALEGVETDEMYTFRQVNLKVLRSANKFSSKRFSGGHVLDWGPTVFEILKDVQKGVSKSIISAKFHNTAVEMIVEMASSAGLENVVLSGGCFQNKYLLERSITRLRETGFNPVWHQRIPPNDGGIALGQIMGAYRMLKQNESLTDPAKGS